MPRLNNSIEQAIFKTLSYSDIFHFPLSLDEIDQYLISQNIQKKERIKTALKLMKGVYKHDGYVALSRQTMRNSTYRKEWEIEKEKKLHVAKKFARIIGILPTVYFVGISGSVAAGIAKPEDDIDFFIITKAKTLWLTRLLVTGIVTFCGKRRGRSTKQHANMICLNMFLDANTLLFPVSRHDIYTAHEILFLIPLLDRKNTYRRFLEANEWVKTYLYNGYQTRLSNTHQLIRLKKNGDRTLFEVVILFVEWLAQTAQVWYMKRHRTSEEIGKTLLAFHPKDYRQFVLTEYAKRIKTL